MCADVCSCKRLYVCGPHLCGQRGVHGGARDLCGSVQMRVDPGVWKCLCDELFHHPCTTCSGRPPKPPSPWPLKAHSTSMLPTPQLHAPRCSVHPCVLDQEKTKLSGGALVPGPPSPRPLCCDTHTGAFSPAPSTICCSPRSFGLGEGSQVGPPGRALAPHPARSAP